MSQTEAILNHFQKGKSLTPLTALTRFGCMALSQRAGDLRRAGYPVQSEWVTRQGKRFKRYFIVTPPYQNLV